MILDSILNAIGKTPLVPLKRLGADLECNLYAKCEFLNPGGSIKDRIAFRMVEDAEKSGRIKPGDTLIEPTSGNTGIGLALAGAVKGYNIIITMPEKMSREKQVVLEALGARIIRTPTEAAFDDPESHISIAAKLQKELPNAHILDQYGNPSNPIAHFEGTAPEIFEDLNGRVDMVVMGAGTGGTISGVAKYFKDQSPETVIVGADPVGSILAGPSEVLSYKVEGIGYDFIPDVLDRNLVTKWVKTEDRQSFLLARRLIKEEGLLCGGSSGSAMYAALKEAKKLKKGQNCVVVLPDGVRNYMTKFVDDKWMIENRFATIDALSGTVSDLIEKHFDAMEQIICIDQTKSVSEAIELMRAKAFSQLPVTFGGKLSGILFEKEMLEMLLTGEAHGSTRIEKIMNRNVPTVQSTTPLASLQEILLQGQCAVVVDGQQNPVNIVTNIDLAEWIGKMEGNLGN